MYEIQTLELVSSQIMAFFGRSIAMLGEAAMLIARADDPAKARGEAGEMVDVMIDAFAR